MKNSSPFQQNNQEGGRDAAVQLIRERIQALYGGEKEVKPRSRSELVNRFWEMHKDDPNPQAAWQRFYSGLSDEDKHHLWNDYNQETAPKGKTILPLPKIKKKALPVDEQFSLSNNDSHAHSFEEKKPSPLKGLSKKVKDTDGIKANKEKLLANLKSLPKSKDSQPKLNKKRSNAHWRPLIISLSVMGVWLLAQYNPLVIAFAKQYISPGDTLQSPVIIDPSADIEIGPEPRIIIPKINVDVPVVYDLGTRDEVAIQNALEDGVVHYAGTGEPGESGNNVIVGHSSNNFLNSGKYKFAFVLLDRLEINDTFILHFEGTRYVYKVTNKQVIEPTDFSLVQPTAVPTTTLITCTPPGTSWRRLVIQAEQISPTVTSEQLGGTPTQTEVPQDGIVPGNAPSLFQRFRNWAF